MTRSSEHTPVRPVRRSVRTETQRIAYVLDGLTFPAARWQLLAHADGYGADSVTRAQLWSLPVALYPDLPSVLRRLGLG